MRVKLEEEVGEINDDEDNRGTTAKLEEKGDFLPVGESTIQPLVLGEKSGTGRKRKMKKERLRMRRG